MTSSRSADGPGPGGPPRPDDAATRYAVDVTEGRVTACKWVRLACARHLRDLEHGHERGLWWEAEQVEDQRLFFAGLRHSKGEWARRPIELEPFQLFMLGSIFGWKRANGTRRFRRAYIEIPRKNAKSTLGAGVGIELAFYDDEPGAEVYAAATKREQAKIVWVEAKRMVLKSPSLRTRITVFGGNSPTSGGNLSDHATASKFEPLGADADNLDGLNMHGGIVDELHAHKTRALLDVLDTATGSRRQPLLFEITTAGNNRGGVCYDERTYATKILEEIVTADDVFAIIYTIDEGDDWRDPVAWAKANPMLGISVKRDELEAQAKRADEMPSARVAFLTKRLNVWVNADETFMPAALWARCKAEHSLEDLRDVPCWIGVDLATKSDLAAVVAVFLRDDDVVIKPTFYLPADMVEASSHDATAHFAGWAASGHLKLTKGSLIDFAVIRDDLRTMATTLATRELDFDPYQAAQIIGELQPDLSSHVELVEIPQTVKHLSGPMKAWRDKVIGGQFHHDGNPVMTWCVSNVVAHEDANENVFPRKMARHLKIDGVSAMLNALSRALAPAPAEPEPRVTVVG